jgi:hypothetical protein
MGADSRFEYDSLWLAMSPKEAHRLAALLDRCATAAEQAHRAAAGQREPTERLAA